MKTTCHNNQCRRIRKDREGLLGMFRSRVIEKLSNHIADCPRCQQRLAVVNRVEVAMMMVRTQQQDIGLLAKANHKALNTLKHSLRNAPKSLVLRTAKADTSRFEKIRPGLERILNIAACVFVVVMIKTGVSNSLLNYKRQGEDVIHNYYARNLDSQTFDELFPEDSSPIG